MTGEMLAAIGHPVTAVYRSGMDRHADLIDIVTIWLLTAVGTMGIFCVVNSAGLFR